LLLCVNIYRFSDEDEPIEEEQDIDDAVDIVVQSDDEEEYVLQPHHTIKLDADETYDN
jgi:hypothetical protein